MTPRLVFVRLALAIGLGLAPALILGAPVAAQAGEAKKAKSPYVQIDTLAAGTNRLNGKRGVLTVELGVYTDNAALRDKVDLYIPVLRSAYISALQPYALSVPPGSPPSADYIGMTLQRETDKVLGRGAKVLLGSILLN